MSLLTTLLLFLLGCCLCVMIGLGIGEVVSILTSERSAPVVSQVSEKNSQTSAPEETTEAPAEPPTKADGTLIHYTPVTMGNLLDYVPAAAEPGESTTDLSAENTTEADGQSLQNGEEGSGTEQKVLDNRLSGLDAGELAAQCAFVLDLTSMEACFQMNSYQAVSPASTTKLMTALTVIEYASLTEVVTIGNEINLIGAGSSVAYLSVGQQMTVEALLNAMLVPSGNDAAYALAAYVGRLGEGNAALSDEDAVRRFVELMNENAACMGLKNTHFASPDGYDAEGQFSCAYDLAVIAWYITQNPTLQQICGQGRVRVVSETGQDVTYQSSNQFLLTDSPYYKEYVTGMKTGSSGNAGKCLISTAERDGRRILCVVLNAADDTVRYGDSLLLIEAGLGNVG